MLDTVDGEHRRAAAGWRVAQQIGRRDRDRPGCSVGQHDDEQEVAAPAPEAGRGQQLIEEWVHGGGDAHLARQQSPEMLQSVAVPTGVGKTYVACALANAAIRHGHPALYVRAPRLFEDLAIARADGRLAKLMASLGRVEVLVVDDLFIRPCDTQQAADLLEVVEDRHQLRATIAASQLPVAHWHESIGDATIADAILDRLLQHAHRIALEGESLRRQSSAPKTRRARSEETKNQSQTDSEEEVKSGDR